MRHVEPSNSQDKSINVEPLPYEVVKLTQWIAGAFFVEDTVLTSSSG